MRLHTWDNHYSVLRAVEILLLLPAFGFLIPPVRSTPEPQRLFPGIIFAGVAFAASLMLAHRRGAETGITATTKLLLFLAFGWLLFARVTAN